jgi:rhamnogalacturonyl hydrolase YesR
MRYFNIIVLAVFLFSCSRMKPVYTGPDDALGLAASQYELMYDTMKSLTGLLPKTIYTEGELVTAGPGWWTSGFFPGTLWYLYEYTGDERFRDAARDITSRIESQKDNKGTHDLGFMLYCSFGNGLRLTSDSSYRDVLLEGARSLSSRFRPVTGCIQSWNSNRNWQCPVIIDNMMNLELLMWAFRETGDSSFYKIAVSHADNTIKNHFRDDFSSWHVVSYDTISGQVETRQTHQGFSDESAWARGQAWGLYGFVVMYRETGFQRYLDQAVGIASFMINHSNMPEDMIPYWDFNAPGVPDALRDASAGAIMASALIELSGYVDDEQEASFLRVAEKQLQTLSSPEYLAAMGQNGHFILKHSVGSLRSYSEVDVPLTYAVYYFIEALLRYKALVSEGVEI